MAIIRPKNGVNLRLPASEIPENQWALMQNMDMKHNENFEQINGSVKYHGANLGTSSPSAVMINYDNENDKQDVLVAIDGTVQKKNLGANEFETLISELTPNKLRFHVNINSKTYMAHPDDGYFEYDGVAKIKKIVTNSSTGGSIKLKDVIFAKEVNRAFGILADIPNALVWSDDVVNTGGVPISWPGTNISTFAPTEGDEIEKLWILDGRLVLLMTNSIWLQYINGAPTNWRPERSPTAVGCIAPKTVKQVGRELWFLGFSPATGRGIYAFNGRESRLLSYDVEPFLNRINELRIQESSAELVDNIYKISFAIDASSENNYTFHLDTININPNTNSPNVYGPHTYGFNSSAVLNTKKFKGEHLFGRKHSDGGRVFKVLADYRTQYSEELVDNGSLIQTSLLSRIVDKEQIGKNVYDETWMKRYEKIFAEFIPTGTWSANVEILQGYENETFSSYDQYMDAINYSVENLDLDSLPINFQSLGIDPHLEDILSDAIQLKVTNSNLNTKMGFRSLRYDARPVRRKKVAQHENI